MRKTTVLLLLLLLFAAQAELFGGGMVHNTNQSAAWIRMPIRDASTSIDAVYFNPAGLTKLPNGIHFSASNQYIVQTRKITSGYPLLNNDYYEGETLVPVLPNFYVAYKKGKLALSGGFMVIGGGGAADFNSGLPSFEIPFSNISSSLTASGIAADSYSADVEFEGFSSYYGIQANVSYAVTDNLSLAVGGRYVMAKNTYTGSIKNIMINPTFTAAGFDGSMVSAPTFFTTMATYLNTASQTLSGTASSLQTLIDGGGSTYTLEQAESAGYLSSDQVTAISQGIQSIDESADPSLMNIATIQAVYTAASETYTKSAELMSENAESTSNKEADVVQRGSTFTPIVGSNISLLDEKLNIAIKYEFKSEMEVENDTKVDDTGLFPDKEKIPADIPAQLAIGVSCKPISKLLVAGGFHYYWDKNARYGRKIDDEYVTNELLIDNNLFEVAGGLQYNITEKLALSGGYLFTSSTPEADYQNDISYSLSSHSLGLGGIYKITPKLSVDFGFMYSAYVDDEEMIDYSDYGITDPVKQTYDKINTVVAIGLNYSILRD